MTFGSGDIELGDTFRIKYFWGVRNFLTHPTKK
jgi:hypothetical protein